MSLVALSIRHVGAPVPQGLIAKGLRMLDAVWLLLEEDLVSVDGRKRDSQSLVASWFLQARIRKAGEGKYQKGFAGIGSQAAEDLASLSRRLKAKLLWSQGLFAGFSRESAKAVIEARRGRASGSCKQKNLHVGCLFFCRFQGSKG